MSDACALKCVCLPVMSGVVEHNNKRQSILTSITSNSDEAETEAEAQIKMNHKNARGTIGEMKAFIYAHTMMKLMLRCVHALSACQGSHFTSSLQRNLSVKSR